MTPKIQISRLMGIRAGGRFRSCLVSSVLSSTVAFAVPTTSFGAPTTTTESAVDVEVEVSAAIEDSDGLASWTQDEVRKVIVSEPRWSAPTGTIRVIITGATYDYRIRMEVRRNGGFLGEPKEWSCECTNEELFAAVRRETKTTMAQLRGIDQESEDEPQAVVSPHVDRDELVRNAGIATAPAPLRRDEPSTRGLGPLGWVGVGLTAGGVTATAAGIGLVVADERPGAPLPRNPERLAADDYRTPGIPVLVAGTVLIVGGIVAILIERRRGQGGAAAAWRRTQTRLVSNERRGGRAW